MKPLLEVKDVSVRLGGKAIIRHVNFSLERAQSMAIIGPNGSGKTVLLRALLNMAPYEGEIILQKGARLGYVPQKIDADRHLPLTFMNLFAAKAEALKLPHSDIQFAIHSARLSDAIMKTPVGHLSGGQFQRGLIGFAVLGKPDIILLDEPTASIDAPGEEEMYDLIHRLQDEFEMSVIVVSHDLSFVYRYAGQVLCLNGKGICFGPPQDVLTSHTLKELYGSSFTHYHHLH